MLLGGLEDDIDEGGDVGHVEDAIAVEVVGIVLFHCAENHVDEACHVGHIIFLLVSLLLGGYWRFARELLIFC